MFNRFSPENVECIYGRIAKRIPKCVNEPNPNSCIGPGPGFVGSKFFFFYIFSVLGVPPQPEVLFTTLESVSKRAGVSWTRTWTPSRSNQNQKSAVAFADSVYSRTEQTNGSMPSALQSTLTTCSFAPKAAENLAHVACAAPPSSSERALPLRRRSSP
jgi:hypothetical protein